MSVRGLCAAVISSSSSSVFSIRLKDGLTADIILLRTAFCSSSALSASSSSFSSIYPSKLTSCFPSDPFLLNNSEM